jgi:hypothetical protein
MNQQHVKQLALNEGDLSFGNLFGDTSKKEDQAKNESQDPWKLEPEDHVAKMFVVSNKRQKVVEKSENEDESSHEPRKRDDGGNYYICARSTKRNPDLLIPGGTLKGNMYFQSKASGKKDDADKSAEASESDDDDAFSKLKNQISRYFIESNPTIKCRNCKEFGHFARECPNERKGLNCILCGKDTHDSFDCNEKLCFKCNKVGHKANECKETDVVKCLLCGQIGH